MNYVVDDPKIEKVDLPSKFDLRDVNGACYVPEVRFQNPFGTCWSFGSTAAAEISLAAEYGADFNKMTDEEKSYFDFSERHTAWFAFEPIHEDDPMYPDQAGEGTYRVYSADYLSPQEQAVERFNSGGNIAYALPMFAAGVGPVSESFVPYMNKEGVYEANLDTYVFNTEEEYKKVASRKNKETEFKKTVIYSKVNMPYEDYIKKLDEAKKVAKNFADGWQGAGKYFLASYMPSASGDWTVDYSKKYSYAWQIDNASRLPGPMDVDNDTGAYIYCESGTNAIKKELCSGRGVAVHFLADHSMPGDDDSDSSYLNFLTKDGKPAKDAKSADIWAQYTYDKTYDPSDPESVNKFVGSNHVVCIVGYDDDFPKEYFNDPNGTIGGNGAWIIRNSWGSKDNSVDSSNNPWGNGGDGYCYISYYDQSLFFPQSFDFRTPADGNLENSDGIYNHMYDHLITNLPNEFYSDHELYMANEFTEEGDSVLTDIGVTTVTPNTTAKLEVYFLNDDSKNPTDGTKMLSAEKTFEYGGFHCVALDKPLAIPDGQRYAIVAKEVREDGKATISYNYGMNEKGFKEATEKNREAYIEENGDDLGFRPGYYIDKYVKGVINNGESFVGAIDQKGSLVWEDWKDVSDVIKKKENDNIDFDNFSIRAYVNGNVIEVKNTVDNEKEYYKEGDVIKGSVIVKNDISSNDVFVISNIDLVDSLGAIDPADRHIDSLAPGESATVKYEYIVTAEDAAAGSVVSTVNITVDGTPYTFVKELAKNSFTVLTAAAPNAPTNVKVDKKGRITWDAAENAEYYKAVMAVNGFDCFGEKVTGTSYTFKYKPSNDYQVYVIAYGKGDTSATSKAIEVTAENAGTIAPEGEEYSLDLEVRKDGAYVTRASGANNVTEIVIPDKTDAGIPIVGIDDFAFYGCTSLEKVSVPDTVKAKNIGDTAFLTRKNIEDTLLANGQDQKLSTGLAYAANVVNYKGRSDWEEGDKELEGAEKILRGIMKNLGCDDKDTISLAEAASIVRTMYLYNEMGLEFNIVRADDEASTAKMSEKSYEKFVAWVKAIPEDVTIVASKGSDAEKYAKGKKLIGIKFEAEEITEPEKHLKGDANSDGVVNVRDAAFIAAKLAQGKSGELPEYADFNDDSVVNVRDAAAIARYLAFRKDFDEYAQTDEYIQRMACQSAGEQAHKAVREEYGEGDWITDYPTILSYTDKNNYEISVKIYIKDKPETAHTYINKNVNGKFSFEKAD